MVQLILDWLTANWYLAPTVITIASAIAKSTDNTTDNKLVAMLQKIVDTVAMSSTPTKLKD